jgi:glycogen operon protein
MLLMGDEIRRTQRGNNNAYCQDNELSWFNWDHLEKEEEFFRFTRELIGLNLSSRFMQELRFWSCFNDEKNTIITWHGTRLGQPDWADHSHSLAFHLQKPGYGLQLFAIINAYWEPLTFELPQLSEKMYRNWFRLLDTALPSPEDVVEPAKAPPIDGFSYQAESRSVVLALAIAEEMGPRIFRDSKYLATYDPTTHSFKLKPKTGES